MIRPIGFTRRINMRALVQKLEPSPIHFDRIEYEQACETQRDSGTTLKPP